eukprot:1161865-Pelagomonas_calceolata.AAC.23
MSQIRGRTASSAEKSLAWQGGLSESPRADDLCRMTLPMGLQGVGLQPENLAGWLLVKHSHPASSLDSGKHSLILKGVLAGTIAKGGGAMLTTARRAAEYKKFSICYPDSFEKAVLANTNAGGENCHRGAALGALMGAALGESKIPPNLIQQLSSARAGKPVSSLVPLFFYFSTAARLELSEPTSCAFFLIGCLQGLHDSSAIRQEMDAFCRTLYPEHKEL